MPTRTRHGATGPHIPACMQQQQCHALWRAVLIHATAVFAVHAACTDGTKHSVVWLFEQGVDLIFYGDSITWLFRGDDINGPNAVGDVDRQRGDVFRRHFGQYRTAIQAIPGVRGYTLNLLLTGRDSSDGLLTQALS